MKIFKQTLTYNTKQYCEFIDITDDIQSIVTQSGVQNGIVTAHSQHTTFSVRINEKETGITKDFKALVSKLIPPTGIYYHHNDLTIRTENLVDDPNASDYFNAHSHLTHLLMGTSEMMVVENGKVIVGQWQKIFGIELDCARTRNILVQVMGE